MKTYLQIILIGFYLVNVSFVSGDGNKKKSEKEKSHKEIGLIVYGQVLNSDIKLNEIEFKLYEANDMVVQGKLNRKGEFEIPLYLSENYVLELNAPGYLAKRFYFNTNTPPGLDKVFVFGFSARLLREESVKGADTFSLDFPYALVSYNEKTYEFGFSEKYSRKMKEDELNAIDQSQNSKQ